VGEEVVGGIEDPLASLGGAAAAGFGVRNHKLTLPLVDRPVWL
jgi:hypothetical protein